MKLADKWVHPTSFTGNWPDWSGYTWLDWNAKRRVYHPGEDYNFGWGDQDCGQNIGACAAGVVWHTSEEKTGYGNLIILKHRLGYNLKRFVKETYGIETDELYSLYAHLKDIIVAIGNEVDEGSLIGHVGKTGTEWCHLHFEIYSLWKDLQHTNYRFYPTGWSKEKVKENWLPAYQFIEATKNLESYEKFLDKPKEYWLQVEKDREKLMKELSDKDKEFLEVKQDYERQLTELRNQNKQMEEESAGEVDRATKAKERAEKDLENLKKNKESVETNLVACQNRNTELLAGMSEKYTLKDIVVMLIKKLDLRG